MSRIPSTGVWKSAQNGNTFGDIISSKNIDLHEDGVLKLSRKAMTEFSYGVVGDATLGEDPAFQGTVLGVVSDSEYAYVTTPSATFVGHLTDSYIPFLQVNSSNSPTHGFDSDIEFFNGLPHVSGGQYVSSLNLGFSTWAARVITGLSTTVPHPLCKLQNKNLLAVGNGNQVKIYNAAYSNTVTILLPSELYVTTMRSRGNNLYIGTRNIFGGEALMCVASGSSVTPDAMWGCGADWIYSMSEYKGTMSVLTSAGQLRYFNGGGFSDIANFPVYYTPFSWSSTNPNNYVVGKATNRSMMASGDFLYINIDGTLNQNALSYIGRFLPNQPSGLWEYSTAFGLVHKASTNFKSRLRLVVTSVDSSFLTTTAHQAQTGDAVYVSSVTLTGLNAGQTYYAIVGSTTTMQLALSPNDAFNGRHITVGGTATTDYIVVDRYETVGVEQTDYAGAVFAFGRAHPNPFFGTEVLFGAGLYDTTLTLYRAAICSLGMGRNRGNFVTPRFYSQAVTDSIKRFVAFMKPLLLDTDKMILKMRTRTRFGLPTQPFFTGSAIWTSATTFTVDTTKYDFKSVQVGDEIQVISGDAAGYLAHINSIENSSSTYTVGIDETMPVSSGTFDLVVDNWTKVTTFTNSSNENNIRGFGQANIGENSDWVQFKVELRGRELKINAASVEASAKK